MIRSAHDQLCRSAAGLLQSLGRDFRFGVLFWIKYRPFWSLAAGNGTEACYLHVCMGTGRPILPAQSGSPWPISQADVACPCCRPQVLRSQTRPWPEPELCLLSWLCYLASQERRRVATLGSKSASGRGKFESKWRVAGEQGTGLGTCSSETERAARNRVSPAGPEGSLPRSLGFAQNFLWTGSHKDVWTEPSIKEWVREGDMYKNQFY